jgi:hypothetical protein
MSSKTLEQCHKHDEFVSFSRSHGLDVCEGKKHTVARNDRGTCAFPRHAGEYGKGLCRSIIKTLSKMLLIALAIGWAYVLIAGGLP